MFSLGRIKSLDMPVVNLIIFSIFFILLKISCKLKFPTMEKVEVRNRVDRNIRSQGCELNSHRVNWNIFNGWSFNNFMINFNRTRLNTEYIQKHLMQWNVLLWNNFLQFSTIVCKILKIIQHTTFCWILLWRMFLCWNMHLQQITEFLYKQLSHQFLLHVFSSEGLRLMSTIFPSTYNFILSPPSISESVERWAFLGKFVTNLLVFIEIFTKNYLLA